jgi:hypothetical protein
MPAWRLKQCKNCSELTWALTQTVPLLKPPARDSPSSHLLTHPSTHPRLDGSISALCSSPARPPPKPGPKISNTRWSAFWGSSDRLLAVVSLPSEIPLDLFPPTEYKMESNRGLGLLAAKFSLVQRPLQPLSFLPQSLLLHDPLGA